MLCVDYFHVTNLDKSNPYLKSEPTPFRNQSCAEPHVVAVNERTSVFFLVYHSEIDGVAGARRRTTMSLIKSSE